jgi:pimeloyl-ACP methyl ester carboxylesterase
VTPVHERLPARLFGSLRRGVLRRRVGLVVLGGIAVVAAAGGARWAAQRVSYNDLQLRIWAALHGGRQSRRVTSADGASIFYETFGSGPPVLVLHGGLGSLVDMRRQIELLAPTHRVIAPDSRGHGRSTDTRATLTYDLMARDTVALMDQLGIGKADIVGWSDGAIIGLALAIQDPDRVRRLVAISANFDPAGLIEAPAPDAPIPPTPLRYRREAPDPSHWPRLYREVTAMWRTQPHFTERDLGTIRSPTLVIAGEADVIRREHTDALAKAIPGAEELIVPGSTHDGTLRSPALVDGRIRAFLAPDAP